MQLNLSKEKLTRNFNAIRKRWDNDNFIFSLGSSKTTLVKVVEKTILKFPYHTTRQPRSSETQNQDYFFVNETDFKRLISNEEFLEYAKVFNNFYGTTEPQ